MARDADSPDCQLVSRDLTGGAGHFPSFFSFVLVFGFPVPTHRHMPLVPASSGDRGPSVWECCVFFVWCNENPVWERVSRVPSVSGGGCEEKTTLGFGTGKEWNILKVLYPLFLAWEKRICGKVGQWGGICGFHWWICVTAPYTGVMGSPQDGWYLCPYVVPLPSDRTYLCCWGGTMEMSKCDFWDWG